MQAEKQIANEQSVTRQELQFILGAALIALLLFAYYFYTWRNAYNFRSAMDSCAQQFCDFATFYYPMGEAIFQTELPLKGFVYSPFIAILFAVFPPFGLNASLVLWGILQPSQLFSISFCSAGLFQRDSRSSFFSLHLPYPPFLSFIPLPGDR